MQPHLRRNIAEAAYRRKLEELNARGRPFPDAEPSNATPSGEAGHRDDHLLHATIEVAHHFLEGVLPFEPVAMRACKPANDQARRRLVSQAAELVPLAQNAGTPPEVLSYLPGALQGIGIQVCSSLAMVAATTFGQSGAPEDSGTVRERLSIALRHQAPTIAEDAALAGLSDVAIEIIGALTSDARVVCERFLRVVRFSMFPTLKAIRILAFREPGCSRRESLDSAVKLFVNAAIVGACVVVEQRLHELLAPVFGHYAHLIAGALMAVVCVWACARATDALNALDLADLREERERAAKLASTHADWSQIDLRLEAVRNQLSAV